MFKLDVGPTSLNVSMTRPESFLSRNNLFSIQFILNELNSSYFLTPEILIKISSLESLVTHHPEKHENSIVSEFNETFIGQ